MTCVGQKISLAVPVSATEISNDTLALCRGRRIGFRFFAE